jgi:hypothetical protein
LKGAEPFRFAGIPPIVVPALPLERHVAEILHAYSRDYGERHNTRVKDLVDLVLILTTAAFEAGRLRQEIDHTLMSRGIQTIPMRFRTPPDNWTLPYRTLTSELALNPDINVGHSFVAAFLDPILAAVLSPVARWDPADGTWKLPGDSVSPG